MSDNIKAFWDKHSHDYDKSERQFAPVYEKILARTKSYCRKDHILLDFGCATGTKALQLAPLVRKITGIDISPKMIEEAEKKRSAARIENASFRPGTIFDESVTGGSFDIIVSYGVLHLLTDADDTLKRIHALLNPDGLFIASVACVKDKMDVKNRVMFSVYMFLRKLGLFPLHINMWTADDVEQVVGSHFRILESDRMLHGLTASLIVAKRN